MKTNRRNAVTFIISIVGLVSTLITARATLGQTRTAILQGQVVQATVLKLRSVRPKPLHTTITRKVRADVLVVKFREGTRVRERLGLLEADLTNISPVEEQLLQRANLPRQRLFEDLAQINTVVAPNSKRFVKRLFVRTEAELDAEKREGENRSGEELADLNLYHRIFIADANPRETEQLLDQLNALDSVEIAYPQPISQPAQADAAPTTPDFSGSQEHHRLGKKHSGIGREIDIDDAEEPRAVKQDRLLRQPCECRAGRDVELHADFGVRPERAIDFFRRSTRHDEPPTLPDHKFKVEAIAPRNAAGGVRTVRNRPRKTVL